MDKPACEGYCRLKRDSDHGRVSLETRPPSPLALGKHTTDHECVCDLQKSASETGERVLPWASVWWYTITLTMFLEVAVTGSMMPQERHGTQQFCVGDHAVQAAILSQTIVAFYYKRQKYLNFASRILKDGELGRPL